VLSIVAFLGFSFGVAFKVVFDIADSDWFGFRFFADFIWLKLFFSILTYYEGFVALVEKFGLDPTINLFLSRFEAHSYASFKSFISFLPTLRSFLWISMLTREFLYSTNK